MSVDTALGAAPIGLAQRAPRHPPSNGAHRLAWWLAAESMRPGAINLPRIINRKRLSVDQLDRLLSGEVEPSDETAAMIARETAGAVLPDDWARGGPLGWLDKPFDRTPNRTLDRPAMEQDLCR